MGSTNDQPVHPNRSVQCVQLKMNTLNLSLRSTRPVAQCPRRSDANSDKFPPLSTGGSSRRPSSFDFQSSTSPFPQADPCAPGILLWLNLRHPSASDLDRGCRT